jgi:hypothetical protein
MRNIDLPHALPHKRFHANLLKNGVGDQKCQQNQNRGVRMFDFKIREPKSQILQNRGTRTAIKPR